MFAGIAASRAVSWSHDPVDILGRSTRGTQCAFEIPCCTTAAGELFVTFCLCFCAITAGNWCSPRRLWYYSGIGGKALLVVLISAVYGIMALEQVTGRLDQLCAFRMEKDEEEEEEGRM